MTDIEKRHINLLSAVDCPQCGIERLRTAPYPCEAGKPVTVECLACGAQGETTMRAAWHYIDVNAWPLEQSQNKRYPRNVSHSVGEGNGQLQWD